MQDEVLRFAPVFAFIIIGVAGAVGAIGGGLLADKLGKARFAKWAMIVSGGCTLLIGFTYGQSIWVTVIVALIWGASVIADSAQFSALATEYAQEGSVGTALTFQMAVGYLLTIISIYLIPLLVEAVTWQWAFIFLVIGPAIGVMAMQRLIKYEKDAS